MGVSPSTMYLPPSNGSRYTVSSNSSNVRAARILRWMAANRCSRSPAALIASGVASVRWIGGGGVTGAGAGADGGVAGAEEAGGCWFPQALATTRLTRHALRPSDLITDSPFLDSGP